MQSSSEDVPLTPVVVDCVTFDRAPLGRRGYHEEQVDDFLDRVQATLAGTDSLTAQEVRDVTFDSAPLIRRGYHEDQVDEFLDLVVEELERRARERGRGARGAPPTATRTEPRPAQPKLQPLARLTPVHPAPTTGRPAPAPPASSAPAPANSAPAPRTPTAPASPAPTPPTPAPQLSAQPTSTQPTSTQPTSTQPTSTQPTSTQPTSTQPTSTQPTSTQPPSAQPAFAQPAFAAPVPPPTPVEQTSPMLFTLPPSTPAPTSQPAPPEAPPSATGAQAPPAEPPAMPTAPQSASPAAATSSAGKPAGPPPSPTSSPPAAPREPAQPTASHLDAWRDSDLLALPLPPAPPGERGYRPGDVERLINLLANAINDPDSESPTPDDIAGLKLSRTFFIGQGYHTAAVDTLRATWIDELRRRAL